MRPPYCFLLIGLLLLCSTQTIAFAQSGTYQTIPESLRGYWQFKADNVSDWNGPLIGENFVENYYVVFYAEQIKQEADGSYFFHLRNHRLTGRMRPIDSFQLFIRKRLHPDT